MTAPVKLARRDAPGSRGPLPRPVEERFWPKVNRDGPEVRPGLGPCWVWTAATDHKGYGKILRARRFESAHRVGWDLQRGPIPEGLWVLHRCDNPPCVRADHLFLGTALENNRDTVAKGRRGKRARRAAQRNIRKATAAWSEMCAERPTPECVHCGADARRRWQGRCHTCHEYFRRRGVDRSPELLRGIKPVPPNSRLTESDVVSILRRVQQGERQVDIAADFGVTRNVVNAIVHGRTWRRVTASLRLSDEAASVGRAARTNPRGVLEELHEDSLKSLAAFTPFSTPSTRGDR